MGSVNNEEGDNVDIVKDGRPIDRVFTFNKTVSAKKGNKKNKKNESNAKTENEK